MKKLIVANWKSYVASEEDALALAEVCAGLKIPKEVEVVVCPPAVYLDDIKGKLGEVKLGAQNVSLHDSGAMTGAVTIEMLQDIGAEYVILGHSERRAEHETNEEIKRKVDHAIKAGLKVVLCVGESEEIRKLGLETALNFVCNELSESLPELQTANYLPTGQAGSLLTVAYEPVWAISKAGEGRHDTPDDASTMIMAIKAFLSSKFTIEKPVVLYGGSLNSENAAGFLSKANIDGGLVGYASTKAEEFKKIIDAAG